MYVYVRESGMSYLVADVGICAVAEQQSRHLQVASGNSVLDSVVQSRSAVLHRPHHTTRTPQYRIHSVTVT